MSVELLAAITGGAGAIAYLMVQDLSVSRATAFDHDFLDFRKIPANSLPVGLNRTSPLAGSIAGAGPASRFACPRASFHVTRGRAKVLIIRVPNCRRKARQLP
jgi:hypothetical protein